jgi:hypothetical protein
MTTPSGPRVQIRPRASDDLPAAAAALVHVHHSDGYPVEGVDDPAAWLTSPHQIAAWVAELDEHIVGHAAIGEPQPASPPCSGRTGVGPTSGASTPKAAGLAVAAAAKRVIMTGAAAPTMRVTTGVPSWPDRPIAVANTAPDDEG